MPISVQWSQSQALVRRIEAVRAAARPGSRANTRALGAIRAAVVADHKDKMLGNRTRYGTQRAALAQSTLANPRRGPGPSLVPRGESSRYLILFYAEWQPGATGSNVLVMGWRGFKTKSGIDIPSIHEKGARIVRGGRTIVIPARPVAGITPKGFTNIKEILHDYGIDVLKGA